MLLTERPQWHALQEHARGFAKKHLFELFQEDPERCRQLAFRNQDLYVDFSKQRIGQQTLALLIELASGCGLTERIAAMFAGATVNPFESRPALH